MSLVVQKYGGSSLRTPGHIRGAASRIASLKKTGHGVVVVVSAMGRTTDYLIRLAGRTVKHPPQRELDMLMTAGERISMALLAMALDELGVPAISFTGSQAGVVTTSDHMDARILEVKATRIQEELAKGKVVIIAGFQGVSREREITTLGRGGSDTSAVAIAAALGAGRCEVLTDVDGLFTADPRLVPNARLLERVSYAEALEFATLGAKMHSRSIEVAKRFGVDLHIGPAGDPTKSGTHVGPEEKRVEETRITGIGSKDGYQFFEVKAGLEQVAPLLKRCRVPLRFFSATAEQSRFVCEGPKAPAVTKELESVGLGFQTRGNVAVVSAVGDGFSAAGQLVPDFLEALAGAGAAPLLVSFSTVSLCAAVDSARKGEATRALHARFVEG